MGDVIPFKGKLKDNLIQQAVLEPQEQPVVEIIDITEKRQEALQRDRRSAKRTVLTEFIAVHVLVPGQGLLRVTLHDIHQQGLAFDLDSARGKFQVGEEVAMRVYLNHKTYFGFVVTIKNTRYSDTDETIRHGGEFVAGTLNEVALSHFIQFLENISVSLKSDKGDLVVTNVNS